MDDFLEHSRRKLMADGRERGALSVAHLARLQIFVVSALSGAERRFCAGT